MGGEGTRRKRERFGSVRESRGLKVGRGWKAGGSTVFNLAFHRNVYYISDQPHLRGKGAADGMREGKERVKRRGVRVGTERRRERLVMRRQGGG